MLVGPPRLFSKLVFSWTPATVSASWDNRSSIIVTGLCGFCWVTPPFSSGERIFPFLLGTSPSPSWGTVTHGVSLPCRTSNDETQDVQSEYLILDVVAGPGLGNWARQDQSQTFSRNDMRLESLPIDTTWTGNANNLSSPLENKSTRQNQSKIIKREKKAGDVFWGLATTVPEAISSPGLLHKSGAYQVWVGFLSSTTKWVESNLIFSRWILLSQPPKASENYIIHGTPWNILYIILLYKEQSIRQKNNCKIQLQCNKYIFFKIKCY